MDKRKIIIIAITAAVLLACMGGVAFLAVRSGNDQHEPETTIAADPEDTGAATDPTGDTTVSAQPEETTVQPEEPTDAADPTVPTDPEAPTVSADPTVPVVPTEPTVPTIPTSPTAPTVPTEPANPTVPTAPADPAIPTAPTAPTLPQEPEVTVEDPDQRWKAELLVTCEDGSVAQGAAVIATHSSGRQEYEPTNSNGVAELYLPKGTYSVEIWRDGQHGTVELEISNKPIEQKVRLKAHRTLYILLEASGGYDGDPRELAGFSTLVDAFGAKYPRAVYLTSENRYDAQFRDGDALLSVEVLVDHYVANDRYFAGELRANFTAYQASVTAWDIGEGGEEINIEFIDGNLCSVRVQSDYDYDYSADMTVVTKSYYTVQKDWHLNKYSNWADAWGYGYTMQSVLSTSVEQQATAPGAGCETEAFWYDVHSARFRDYLAYVEQLFPYIDLWMPGYWNEGIEQSAPAQ